jgi:hypothetical protein
MMVIRKPGLASLFCTRQPLAVFSCVEFEPDDPAVMAKLGGRAAFAEMGAANNVVENAWHPFMHRTDLVDYAIVPDRLDLHASGQ